MGARTYSPSIRSRIRRFLSGKGSKKGLLRATRIYVSFGSLLSVVVSGGKHGHLKCRLGNEREKEGGSERKSNIVRGRTNVRGSASGGQCFIGASFRFPFPFRPPRDASTEIKSPPSFNQSTNLLIPDLLASYAPSRT